MALGGDDRCLDQRDVDFAQEAVGDILRHMREVEVEKRNLVGVDLLAQHAVALVGEAEGEGIGLGQGAVDRGAGGGPREKPHFERPAGVMLGTRAGGQGAPAGLDRARGGEPACGDGHAVLDQGGSLVGGHARERITHVQGLP